jgi:thioredoxin-dependent adenylylsulfate APS reductase
VSGTESRSDQLSALVAEAAPRLTGAAPEAILGWALETFPGDRLALATSLQDEGMVLLDMARRLDPGITVFTIDTGRLPQETLDLVDEVRERYGIRVEVVCPDAGEVSELVSEHGPNLFHRSVELRLSCCEVRKVRPLSRRLRHLDAWIAGLRREQSQTRSEVAEVELDAVHGGIVKLNPLARWTHAQVQDYIAANHVPRNALYSRGYLTIGCAPCTRASAPGEDPRAGRWWWEQGDKECGINYEVQVDGTGLAQVISMRSKT